MRSARRRPGPRSPWSAACGAAARPAAISTSSPPARPTSLMDAFTGYRQVERVLAHGDTKSSVLLWGGFQADLRLVPATERRRGAAVLHRLEGAQHRAARPRDPARLQAERIRALSESTTARWWRARPRRASTKRSASHTCRRSCARTAARSPRPKPARCPVSSPSRICAATCTCTPRPPTAAPTPGPWRAPPATPDSSTSPSPITARRSRWPTASTSARALEHARQIRALNGRDDLDGLTRARRHRVRHPARRPARPRRRLPRRARHRDRVGPLGASTRTRRR